MTAPSTRDPERMDSRPLFCPECGNVVTDSFTWTEAGEKLSARFNCTGCRWVGAMELTQD